MNFEQGDTIVLTGALTNPGFEMGFLGITGNGETLNLASLVQLAATGSAKNITVYGDYSANILDSGGFAKSAIGNGGGDTFVFKPGYGAVTVDEVDSSATPHNVLSLGQGITADEVTVLTSPSAPQDIVLDIGQQGDAVVLKDMLAGLPFGVQAVTFAGGTQWSRDDLVNFAGAAKGGAAEAGLVPLVPSLLTTNTVPSFG